MLHPRPITIVCKGTRILEGMAELATGRWPVLINAAAYGCADCAAEGVAARRLEVSAFHAVPVGADVSGEFVRYSAPSALQLPPIK